MWMGNAVRGRARQVGEIVTSASLDSGAVVPKSVRRGARTPATATPPVPAEPSPAAAASESSGPFTLQVSGDLDFDTAFDERQRLQALTGFEGWVVRSPDGGGRYRVVVGAYRSHKRATAAANMLLNSRTLPDVTVIPLPPRNVRQ